MHLFYFKHNICIFKKILGKLKLLTLSQIVGKKKFYNPIDELNLDLEQTSGFLFVCFQIFEA